MCNPAQEKLLKIKNNFIFGLFHTALAFCLPFVAAKAFLLAAQEDWDRLGIYLVLFLLLASCALALGEVTW